MSNMNLLKSATHSGRCVLWIGLLAALAAGCSSDWDITRVSGRVTMDGEPLVDASVIFQPMAKADKDGQAGTGSYGRTDNDGRYSLITVFGDKPGAVVGTHKVLISTEGSSDASARSDDNRRPSGETVPLRYRDGSQKFEVPPSGTDQANFDLTTLAAE